jgi:hypothetical protein
LNRDPTNAKQLLEIGLKSHDVGAIVFAHRIFHDMDAWNNNYGDVEFNVAASVEGGNPSKIENYIATHK